MKRLIEQTAPANRLQWANKNGPRDVATSEGLADTYVGGIDMPESICSVEECDRSAITRGWCAKHYRRWQRHGTPLGAQREAAICSISRCEQPAYCHGWCSRHYRRWTRHGDPEKTLASDQTLPAVQRLTDRLDIGDCWEWTGAQTRGYGYADIDGRRSVVHRMLWELLVGPVPDGLELDHLCRNRICANPDHLEPVDHRTNMVRGASPWVLKHRAEGLL